MEINYEQLAILIGTTLVCGGFAIWGAIHATKALIAMKKAGKYGEIAKEFKSKSFLQIIGINHKPSKHVSTIDTAKVVK